MRYIVTHFSRSRIFRHGYTGNRLEWFIGIKVEVFSRRPQKSEEICLLFLVLLLVPKRFAPVRFFVANQK